MKPPRLVLLAVAGVSLFAFSGCSAVGATAIKVDSTTFSSDDVDLLANFQCSSLKAAAADQAQSGQVPKLTRAQVRSAMASVLVTSVLDAKLIKQAGYKPDEATVRSQLAGLMPQIEKFAKGDDQKRLIELISNSIRYEGALQSAIVATIGESTLQQMGQQQASQAVLQAESSARAATAKKASIDVDPAYGLSADGLKAGGEPSLSLAVSSFAKKSTAATASDTWLTGLPANQRCV